MTTPEAPPALADRPQFTAAYWAKAPRQTVTAHIARVTNVDVPEGSPPWVEIVLEEGDVRFRRPKADIQQLLTANLEVNIETLNNELVTGLFVPGCGWAFRMTAEDLADYTKALSIQEHQRQRAAMEATAQAFGQVIAQYLVELAGAEPHADNGNMVIIEEYTDIDTVHMARSVMAAMNQIVSDQR